MNILKKLFEKKGYLKYLSMLEKWKNNYRKPPPPPKREKFKQTYCEEEGDVDRWKAWYLGTLLRSKSIWRGRVIKRAA